MKRLIITFEAPTNMDLPNPWPVGVDVDNNWTVSSGLGTDDGATLIGFGPFGEQELTVQRGDALENPELVVGLSPTFSNHGNFFVWTLRISRLEVRELPDPPAPPAPLLLTISREVQPKEIAGMIFGTGIFANPWWIDGAIIRATPSGGDVTVADPIDDIQPGDKVRLVHWEKDTEGGREVTELTLQQICDAVFTARKHIAQESWRDMTQEELGYADADAADVVLQWAVFGDIVYG